MTESSDTIQSHSLDFLVFSDDWGGHKSSCQHIFGHIAKNHRVLWVNTVGMRSPTLTATDVRKAVHKLSRMLMWKREIVREERPRQFVMVCQPFMLPFGRCDSIRRLNARSVTRSVRAQLARTGIERPVIVTTVPNTGDYADLLGDSLVVYYCVDDFSLWPGLDAEIVRDMEQRLVARADVILAASDESYRRLSLSGKPTYLIPHGVDLAHFSAKVEIEHPVLKTIPEPRVGFFGLIDGRMDQTLVSDVARRMPDYSFVFAGPRDATAQNLATGQNVHFIGQIRYEDLPALIAGLEVLVIPYKTGSLANVLSPLKLREYLATGKPIVSTPIAAARDWAQYVAVASDAEGWMKTISALIRNGPRATTSDIQLTLSKESWEQRASTLLNICERAEKDRQADNVSSVFSAW